MTQTAVRPRRYPFLDELRGAAIVMMVLYHFLYDLVVFAGISFPLYSRPVVIWQNSIGALFITLSGCVSLFSRSNFRRGIKCLLAATAVFLVTAFTAPAPAWFGVLHFLGCAMLLFPLFRPLTDRIPPVWGALGCLFLFVYFFSVSSGTVWFFGQHPLPRFLYSGWLSTILGFPFPGFTSSDYYPILPWLMLFLCGAFLGKLLQSAKDNPALSRSRLPALGFLGRHSLLIYLVHQPVLYGLTWLLAKLI